MSANAEQVDEKRCSACGVPEVACKRTRRDRQEGCCQDCHLGLGKTHWRPVAVVEPLEIHPGWVPLLAAPPTLPAPEASRFEEEARGLYELRAAALDREREGSLRCGHCFRDLEKSPAKSMHVVFEDGSMRCEAPEGQEGPSGFARTFVVHETADRHNEIKARLTIWNPQIKARPQKCPSCGSGRWEKRGVKAAGEPCRDGWHNPLEGATTSQRIGKTRMALSILDDLLSTHPHDEGCSLDPDGGECDCTVAQIKAERDNVARTGTGRCPTCSSPRPELHPAVQHEGEVQICRDPWHEVKS